MLGGWWVDFVGFGPSVLPVLHRGLSCVPRQVTPGNIATEELPKTLRSDQAIWPKAKTNPTEALPCMLVTVLDLSFWAGDSYPFNLQAAGRRQVPR